MTETLARNVQNEVVAGSLSVHSTTYGLQKSLPSDPLSAILLNDIPSLEISHSQCKTLDRCSTTIQQQLEVLDFYDALLVLFNLAAKERTFMYYESLVQYINEANVKGISGRIHFDRVTSKRNYPAIYNVLEISQFLIAKIGVYDTSQSIWLQDLKPLSREHAAKHRRRKRAAKQCKPAIGKFRVTTIREPPFVIYDPNNTLKGEAHNGHYAGYVVDLMEWLKRNLSFTYTMYEPDDMKYGLIDENGNSQGMVGDLLDCKADLAAAAMTITSARSEHIFFTKPYIDAGKTLLAYKGEPKSTGIWAFLNPFDVATRIVVVVCLLGVTAIFFVLGKLSDYSNGNELNSADSQRRVNVTWPDSSLWFLYTTAMQQGPDVVPSMAGKVLVAGWFFFCLVIVATYTANLAAFLTVRSFESTIQSVDDLAAQTEIVYGTINDSSIIEYFSRSPIEVHKRMYNFIINTDDALVDTVEEAYDRVHYKTKGDYVFIWDEPILHYIASHEPCKSQVVGRSFNSQGYGLAMPRGMPYAHNFSLAILKMRELGITDRMSKKWLRSGPCSDSGTTKDLTAAEEIKITDLLGVFIILSVSVGAALLIAVAELLWWRKMKREKVDVTNAE
jgi:ABC-type amino acid transport substrate-binding protein